MHTKLLWLFVWSCLTTGGAFGQDVRSLRAASSKGDGKASLELAELHRFGQAGLGPSADSARYYLARGAEQGNADAQYLWGLALLQGREVAANVPAGLALLEKAAAQKHILALNVLMELYSAKSDSTFGKPKRAVPLDLTKAFAYASQAAMQGDPKGTYYAGRAYYTGEGTMQDDSLAVAYLTRAGNKQYALAQLLLGDIYLQGTTRYDVNLPEARKWYLLAAKHPQAGIEVNTTGKVGLHYVEQATRKVFNAVGLLVGFAPPGSLELKIKN